MVKKTKSGELGFTFRLFSAGFVIMFYLAAVLYVHFIGKNKDALGPAVNTITLAHWQLEDGYREGFNEMIRRFEALKAKQGRKVKVLQTAVPWRGYEQWFLTQLVGGNPADVAELLAPDYMLQEYFNPLSEYIEKENPFNKGTVLEGMAWRDTFVDGMDASANLTAKYADYFGVGTCFHVYRLFANLDLIEEATGSRKMPQDLPEWLDICKKVKEYGKKTGQRIIPIGVRGFDKSTIDHFFEYYFGQVTGNLNDNDARFCEGRAEVDEILKKINDNPAVAEQLLVPVCIVKELGQYFCDGFSSMDLEQNKYLFYSGNTAFFAEGTWNAYSLVKNCPFEVGIGRIPPIGHKSKYSKYFTGKVSESGVGVGGFFGIPKATKHFDLALELLQFMTSYEMNQLTMGSCKWPPAVKKAKFEGILKSFEPEIEGNLRMLDLPFRTKLRYSSDIKMCEALEEVIISDVDNPGEYFMKRFREYKDLLIKECNEDEQFHYRSNIDRELQRSQIAVALLRENLSEKQIKTLHKRIRVIAESYQDAIKTYVIYHNYLSQIKNM
ncbi:MAG: extracellular solute-binding protein [Planctomycetota bacterium]